MSGEPTKDTVALSAFLLGDGGGDEWHFADEIRHAVKRLGFRMPSSQQIAALLVAMTKEDAPRFERRPGIWGGPAEYRVTHWAETGLSNQWRGFERRRTADDHRRELAAGASTQQPSEGEE